MSGPAPRTSHSERSESGRDDGLTRKVSTGRRRNPMRAQTVALILAGVAGGLAVGVSGTVAWLRSGPNSDGAVRQDDYDGDSPAEPGYDEYAKGSRGEPTKGEVHLNEKQLAGLKLDEVEVRRGSLTSVIELPAEVQLNTDRLVHVTPRVSGIVALVEKTLGDRVEAGDLLCVLDSREMGNAKMEYLADLSRFEVSRADYERARTVFENTKKLLVILDAEPTPDQALARAHNLPVGDNKNKLLTAYIRMKVSRRNFERIEELLKSKIASEADFLQVQGAYEIGRADYLSTREEISFNLKLIYLRAEKNFKVAETETHNAERGLHILGLTHEETARIADGGKGIDADISRYASHSPISGIIVDRHLTRGELVDSTTRLYTIADLSDVWVIGRVYERDVRFLKPGQTATVRLNAFPDESFAGVVDYISSRLDPATRTVQARVILPNPERRLRSGMFGVVSVFIERGDPDPSAPGGLLVPIQAVQRLKEGHAVYQVLAPGRFRQVPVQVLARSRQFAEVSGPLKVGDKVVVGDTFVLKSEVGKEEMGGGHSH